MVLKICVQRYWNNALRQNFEYIEAKYKPSNCGVEIISLFLVFWERFSPKLWELKDIHVGCKPLHCSSNGTTISGYFHIVSALGSHSKTIHSYNSFLKQTIPKEISSDPADTLLVASQTATWGVTEEGLIRQLSSFSHEGFRVSKTGFSPVSAQTTSIFSVGAIFFWL